jgi:hypothetical protein
MLALNQKLFNSEINIEDPFFFCDLSCTEKRKKIFPPGNFNLKTIGVGLMCRAATLQKYVKNLR